MQKLFNRVVIPKARQYGISKRRTWRKLHLDIDEAKGEILSAVVSTNNVHDGTVLAEILDGVDGEIEAGLH